MKQKIGETVWVWSPWAYNNVGRIDHGILVEDDGTFAQVRLPDRERPYSFLSSECFPTREALCDHYRKVFE